MSRRKGGSGSGDGEKRGAGDGSGLPLDGWRWRCGAAALSGVLLALSYPPIAWRPLCWLALAPWLTLLLRDRGRGHRVPALLFGVCFFVTGLWWLTKIDILVPFALLPLLAWYPLIFAEIVRRTSPLGTVKTALLLPFAWVAVDFLREYLFTGFNWLLPGHVLGGWSDLRQAADLFGVPGLSLLVLGTNAAAALWGAHLLRAPRKLGIPARARWGTAAVAVGLVLAASAYGSARRRTIVDHPGPRVLCIQPSFPQSLKKEALASIPTADGMRNEQLALSLEGLRQHPDVDLVLWGETMLPGELRESPPGRGGPDPETRTQLLRVADPMGVMPCAHRRLLAGAVMRDADREKRNAALLVGPQGIVEARFDKNHLTPFGEFIPLARSLSPEARKGLEDAIQSFIGFVPDLMPGSAAPVKLEVPGRGTFSLGGLICYEVIFPGPARERVRDGADILVNLSNYAWYGAGMHEQVLDMTRLRAVENRRPVVVATNDGPTAILDGNGEDRARIPSGAKAFLYGAVPLDGRGSLALSVGDLAAWIAVVTALLGAGAGLAAGRRAGRKEPGAPENY